MAPALSKSKHSPKNGRHDTPPHVRVARAVLYLAVRDAIYGYAETDKPYSAYPPMKFLTGEGEARQCLEFWCQVAGYDVGWFQLQTLPYIREKRANVRREMARQAARMEKKSDCGSRNVT